MKQQFSGTLKSIVVNAGSKSEHTAVVLEQADGTWHRIRVIGDNPFQANEALKAHVGQSATVTGEMKFGVLTISGLKDVTIIDPAAPVKKPRGKGPKPF